MKPPPREPRTRQRRTTAMLDSKAIKQQAAALGFAACGLARAHAVPDDVAAHLDRWIANGCHAGMDYMTRYRDLRLDPRLLHPGTRTVISFALPYWQPNDTLIATYALGTDYHDVARSLLRQTGIEGRICVDTAPILEKYWAVQAGMGWIGRHHQLLIPGQGSAFFLCEILSTDEADTYDDEMHNCEAVTSHRRERSGNAQCGSCRRCIDACPTGALLPDGMFDARRCLSYLTIEHHGDIPIASPDDGQCYIYGCDRCLRACPHIVGSPRQTHFPARPELLAMTPDDWRALTPEQYRALFRGSAVKRAKYEGLTRNIAWAL